MTLLYNYMSDWPSDPQYISVWLTNPNWKIYLYLSVLFLADWPISDSSGQVFLANICGWVHTGKDPEILVSFYRGDVSVIQGEQIAN